MMEIKVDPQTENRLKEIAASANASPEALAAEILAAQIKDQAQARYWQERAEDAKRLENMKKSGGLAHDEMMDWLDDLAAGKDV